MSEDERRSEERIRSRGQVVLLAEGLEAIPGTIYDVSTSGLSVETPRSLTPGTPVVLESLAFGAEGVVRHCVQNGPCFRIGLRLKPPEF